MLLLLLLLLSRFSCVRLCATWTCSKSHSIPVLQFLHLHNAVRSREWGGQTACSFRVPTALNHCSLLVSQEWKVICFSCSRNWVSSLWGIEKDYILVLWLWAQLGLCLAAAGGMEDPGLSSGLWRKWSWPLVSSMEWAQPCWRLSSLCRESMAAVQSSAASLQGAGWEASLCIPMLLRSQRWALLCGWDWDMEVVPVCFILAMRAPWEDMGKQGSLWLSLRLVQNFS